MKKIIDIDQKTVTKLKLLAGADSLEEPKCKSAYGKSGFFLCRP